jgi:hypothetical protein
MDPKPSRFAKIVNSLFTWVFVLYFVAVLLPNIVHPEGLNMFLSTPLMSTIVQYKGVPFALYFILVIIANKKLPKWQYIVTFLLMGIYTLGVMYFAPRDMTYGYVDSNGVTTLHEVVITLKDQFSFYGSYLFGIIYAFCLFYLAPITGDHGKTKWVVMWMLIAVALLSCLYSYVAEMDKYKTFFAGAAKNKWALDIRSVYGSKNRFGLVLFAGFAGSLLVCVSKPIWLRPLGYLFALYFTASSYVIRCDDAFLACCFGIFAYVVALLISHFKKHPIVCGIFSGLFVLAIAGAACAIFMPDIYPTNSLLTKAHDFLMQLQSSTGRYKIWANYLTNLFGSQYLFGLGHIGYYISNIVDNNVVDELSLHNGILDYFNAGGIIYLIFLLWMSVKSVIIINKKFSTSPMIWSALIAIFASFFLDGFAETFTPFTARFINTAAISYLITAWPMSLPEKKTDATI